MASSVDSDQTALIQQRKVKIFSYTKIQKTSHLNLL